MNKEQLFQQFQSLLNSGDVTKEEISNRLGLNTSTFARSRAPEKKHFDITKMLYTLGGVIVAIGLIIFVGQIWDDIGSVGRIAVTFGLGLIFAGVGTLLIKQKPEDIIGQIFHAIGGLLVPGGALVTLDELNADINSIGLIATTFAVIFAFYLVLTFLQKKPILTFFAIANGTASLYLFVETLLEGPSYLHGDIYAYLTMAVGLSYLFLAYSFKNGWNNKLGDTLNFIGSAAFLGAAFSRVFDSIGWQLIFFILVLGGVFLSTVLKSRSILTISTLFLIAHVAYITGEYFADSLGWPISLVALGFIFIGLAYASITINKKYIKN